MSLGHILLSAVKNNLMQLMIMIRFPGNAKLLNVRNPQSILEGWNLI